MGETSIQWTDYTFNPWIGCEKVSPGCANCYAEVDTFTRVRRAQGVELWGRAGHRHVTSDANWRKPRLWNERAAVAEMPPRVFCASLADVFEEREDLDAPRARLFRLIEDTQNLTWLLLTKRPWGLVNLVPRSWQRRFPHNVWAGTTVENQQHADARIPWLLRAKASVHFVSYEPALGPVDFTSVGDVAFDALHGFCNREHKVDWVIVGGESGPRARPCHVAWPRSVVQQCRAAGLACFVKQMGRWIIGDDAGFAVNHWLLDDGTHFVPPLLPSRNTGRPANAIGFSLYDSKGGDMAEWSEDLRVREFPA